MNTSRFFYVTGIGPFPVDMLRFDACWPETQAGSQAIVDSLQGHSVARYVVPLVSNALYSPHALEWRQRGFDVIEAPSPPDLEDLALDVTMFPQGCLS